MIQILNYFFYPQLKLILSCNMVMAYIRSGRVTSGFFYHLTIGIVRVFFYFLHIAAERGLV